jgi:hypothetical protein
MIVKDPRLWSVTKRGSYSIGVTGSSLAGPTVTRLTRRHGQCESIGRYVYRVNMLELVALEVASNDEMHVASR